MKTKKHTTAEKETRTGQPKEKAIEKKVHLTPLDDKDEEKRNHRVEKKVTAKDK